MCRFEFYPCCVLILKWAVREILCQRQADISNKFIFDFLLPHISRSSSTSCPSSTLLWSQMRLLWYLALTLLYSLSVSSDVQSLKCRETETPWPVNEPKFCRDKCRPGTVTSSHFVAFWDVVFDSFAGWWPWLNMCFSGTRLDNRNSTGHCMCVPCGLKKYKQRYNIDFTCDVCEICERRE